MKTRLTSLFSAALLGLALLSSPSKAAAADVKPYPLDTCLVSGNKLGTMGKVVTKEYQGQEIKFCCKPCIKKFEAAPDKYLKKLK